MQPNQHLEEISRKSPDERRLALENILRSEALSFTLQEAEPAPAPKRFGLF